MTRLHRAQLLADGKAHINKWCALNGVVPPTVTEYPGNEPDFGVCAYYRDSEIHIWPEACAMPGTAGRAWSWPGYVVDRTPYGVLAHELGHHVDKAHGARGGIRALEWYKETKEAPITTYCPDVNEWFAEIFRLYVTNPGLLLALRPAMYLKLASEWRFNAETRDWQTVLEGAGRQIKAAMNKIAESEKKRHRQPVQARLV